MMEVSSVQVDGLFLVEGSADIKQARLPSNSTAGPEYGNDQSLIDA